MSADMSFGEWLKRRRRGLGLTQVALGERIGYSGETVRKVEADEFRPSRHMAERLADVFDIPTEEHDRFVRFARGVGAADTPPLPTQPTPVVQPPAPRAAHNLPVPPTPLVGRERELAALHTLLGRDDVRLLTLTGAGGTGKTRLALAAAEAMLGHVRDGVTLVDLAPIRDPALVVSTMARALDVREVDARPLLQVLIEQLRSKNLLLVLDNFEQVAPAAVAVAELLAGCPHLKVLVTSRAPLRIKSEHEFPVAPLAVPLWGHAAAVQPALLVSQYPAVDLFVQRAQAVLPDFTLTRENAEAVVAICQRLDGLPLALELAAARVKALPPQAIAARLTQPLRLLTSGPRDAPARQKTMRDTIAWSYDLLDGDARTLFRRLGVFVGGCSLEAVAAVYRGLSESDVDVLDGLTALVEQSLLQPGQPLGDEARFTMLETIREYALEQLEASGEEAAVRRQHLAFYVALADTEERRKYGDEGPSWVERLGPDVGNLRTAMAWALAQASGPHLEGGVLLAGLLWEFWYVSGSLNEGRRWLSLAVNSGASRGKGRALALTGVGMGAAQQGDNAEAHAALQESIAIWRDLGDTVHLTEALHILGHVVFDQQKFGEAGRLFAESLAFYDQIGAVRQTVELTSDMGLVALHEGRCDAARTWLEAAAGIARTHDLKDELAGSLERLADVDRLEGDFPRAAERYVECLEIHREVPARLAEASCLHKLGRVALHEGEYERARQLIAESLALQEAEGNRQGIAECLTGLGGLALAVGEPQRAATLLAAGRALLDVIGAPLAPPDTLALERDVAAVREQLEPAEFERCWHEGQAMPPTEAVAYALAPGVGVSSNSTLS